jgi:TIR domain
MRAHIFISYSRRDQQTASGIAEQLEQLVAAGTATVWYDRDLELGESWEGRVVDEVRRADIVLLLVSPSYLASQFVSETELPLIQERAEGGARVMPVIIAPCQWRSHPYIGSLQVFAQGQALKVPTTITFGRQVAELVEELSMFIERAAETPRVADDSAALPQPSVATPATDPPDGPAESGVSRIDERGRAFKGSQLQMQIYVNVRTRELDDAVRQALPSIPAEAAIDWASPLASEGFAEYKDRAFLDAVGHRDLIKDLAAFWPRGGPRWDALARVRSGDRVGVLLAEGKSYPEELAGGGLRAEGNSRARILDAIAQTQQALGVSIEPEPWLGRFYQFANRLAHLLWLRRCGVDAWLVHVLFTGDPHGPTTEKQWLVALDELHAELGVTDDQLTHVGTALLPASDRSVLEMA